MFKKNILFCFFTLACLNLSLMVAAQETGKFQKNLQIKGKTGKDSTEKQINPRNSTSDKDKKGGFWFEASPKNRPMVAEDTLNIDDGGEPEQVIVTNEVLIDSNWIKVDSVFAIWDTYNIDPYRKNPNELKDTISLQLYASNHPWAFPLNRCHLTSPFGYRWYRLHPGTDLALNTGDSVKAAFDGVVRVVRWDGYGYGYFIVLRHYNGLETLYGHLSKQLVVPHQYVKAGDLIGWGGSTGRSSGPHLHYETRYRGDTFNPGYIYDFAKNGNIKSESLQLTKNNFSYSFQRPAAAQRGYGYPTRSAVYHLLKNGETLGHLAAKYRTSVAYICRLNGISPRTLIRAGRYIRVR